jgi:hypothetical protein
MDPTNLHNFMLGKGGDVKSIDAWLAIKEHRGLAK